MGPASISQEYKSTPAICHNRTTGGYKSQRTLNRYCSQLGDFINLLLAREKDLPFAYFEELLHVAQE